MKFKSLGLTVILMTFAGSALAQIHISYSGRCKEGPSQSMDIGDRAGHQFIIMKLSCEPTGLVLAGLKATKQSVTEVVEVDGAKFQDRGYAVLIMENGDKVYSRTQDIGLFKEGGAFNDEGTWSVIRGTGKLKGIRGKGTYKSSGVAGSGEESQTEGDYTLQEATVPPKK